MAATLLEYAQTQFPGHETSVWEESGSGLVLTDHTLVVHVVGVKDAAAVIGAAQQQVGGEHVAAIVVRRLQPSVLPKAEEDRDGLYDLPDRRLVAATAIGAMLGLGMGFLAGALVGDSAWVALIAAAFFGVVGGTLGFVVGGGARHASNRAVSQPQVPGRDVAIVAAFLHDEAAAVGLAHTIADLQQQYDVRIVSADGAWHTPNT
jgi:hypothetical protein